MRGQAAEETAVVRFQRSQTTVRNAVLLPDVLLAVQRSASLGPRQETADRFIF